MNAPGFAMRSFRDGLKEQIAPIHTDFVCGIVPPSRIRSNAGASSETECPLHSIWMSAFSERECRRRVYSVEKLENSPAANSSRTRLQSPIAPVSRQRAHQIDLSGTQYEIACPPRVRNQTKPLKGCNFFGLSGYRVFQQNRSPAVSQVPQLNGSNQAKREVRCLLLRGHFRCWMCGQRGDGALLAPDPFAESMRARPPSEHANTDAALEPQIRSACGTEARDGRQLQVTR